MKLKDIHPIRAAIALILVGSTCYMYIASIAVPDALIALAGAAIGFYFRLSSE